MNNPYLRSLVLAVTLLIIPLLGSVFSEEWNWTPSDFIIMGAIIFIFSLAYSLITQKIHSTKKRMIVGLVTFPAFLYVWAELAVGIFTK